MHDARGGGEFAAIERIVRRLGTAPAGEVWAGDDAAVIRVGGASIVVAADALVAGVHADLNLTTLADLGWKALAVNISDLAALGCLPTAAVVTVTAVNPAHVDDLYDGLTEASAQFGCPIVGGDLTSGPNLVVSITVVGDGDVSPPPVLRSGARPGDEIWVTGPLGGAAAGLRRLRAGAPEPALMAAHARPVPRVREGTAARQAGATAMIDVSDGLAADLGHVLDASGVGCELGPLPVAPGATAADAVTGGDDYELVFCAPAGTSLDFAGLRPPIRIGRCVEDVAARTLAGAPLVAGGWDHWA